MDVHTAHASRTWSCIAAYMRPMQSHLYSRRRWFIWRRNKLKSQALCAIRTCTTHKKAVLRRDSSRWRRSIAHVLLRVLIRCTMYAFAHTEGSKQVLKEGHCSNSLANERAFIKTRFQNWLVPFETKQQIKKQRAHRIFRQTMTDACIIIILLVWDKWRFINTSSDLKGFNFKTPIPKQERWKLKIILNLLG
jgi:hypothetical protein